MPFTSCTKIAVRIGLAAAVIVLGAGSLSPVAHAEPVPVYAQAAQTDDTAGGAAVAGLSDGGNFAVDTHPVAWQAKATAPSAHVSYLRGHRLVARWNRFRYLLYQTTHLFPRPGFDPVLVIGIVLGLGAILLGVRYGFPVDDEQAA